MQSDVHLELREQTLFISGVLGFTTVAEIMRQMESLSRNDIRQFDCSGVTHSDSAAVSLLLYFAGDGVIGLHGVNASLQGLIDLYGVTQFFRIHSAESMRREPS